MIITLSVILSLLTIALVANPAVRSISTRLPVARPRTQRRYSDWHMAWMRDEVSTFDRDGDEIPLPEPQGGLFSGVRRIFQRTITWNKIFGDEGYGHRTASGKRVNEETALKYSVVWAATTLIADAVSMLPPEAVREDPETGRISPAPLPGWIRSPHPELRRMDVINQLVISVLLWGNAYAFLLRRESDLQIVGLRVIDPQNVTCEWNPDKPGYRRYRINNGPWLSSAEIFHVQGPTMPGHAKGMSIIRQAREAIALGLTLEEFGARYFGQGSHAKVVIKIPKLLNDDQVKQVMRQYEMAHKGPVNWHRPAVATGGGEIQDISIPPEDAQFLQSREFQALDVARWFRVPPHRVGIVSAETSWGSGIAEQNTALHQQTYGPHIKRFEEAFTAYSPGGEGKGIIIRLNTSESLRGTFGEQVEAWGTAVEKRIATQNEARKALGLDPREGGDKLAPLSSAPPSSGPPSGDPPAGDPPSGGQPAGDPGTRGRRPFRKNAAT